VLRFVPVGGKEARYLLDARRLEFPHAAIEGRPELPPSTWSTAPSLP